MNPKSPNAEFALDAYSFAMRLREAVHDKQHELQGNLLHYWDASCIISALNGYEELRKEHYPDVSPRTHRQLLVSALFSSGQLGQVLLLPGHAIELKNYVSRIGLQTAAETTTAEIIASYPNEFAELSAVMSSPAQGLLTGDQVKNALNRLSALRPSVFVLFISALRGQRGRLQKWLLEKPALIEFAPQPPLVGFQPNQDPYLDVLGALSAIRTFGAGPTLQSRSNVVDATVLTALVAISASGKPPYARFYSTSRALNRLYASSRQLRDDLSYAVPASPAGAEYYDTVWRTADYYYVRSLFPALRMTGALDNARNEDHLPSFDELVKLSGILSQLLDGDASTINHAINEYEFQDGTKLQTIVDAFRNAGMAHAWASLDLGGAAEEFVEQVSGFGQLVRDDDFQTALDGMWPHWLDKAADLDALVFALSVAEEIGRRLRSARGIRNIYSMSALIEDDLMAHRWAVPPDEDLSRALEQIFDWQDAVSRVAKLISLRALRESPARAATLMGVLYAIEADSRIIELQELLGDTESVESSLLYAAAVLRKARRSNFSAASGPMVANLDVLWARASDEERQRLCLGFGHCYLSALLEQGVGAYTAPPSSPKGLLGFEVVVEFIRQEISNMRVQRYGQYAYAINFLAYASIFVPGAIPDAGRMRVQLAEIVGSSPRFKRQYRFLDTIEYGRLRASIDRLGSGNDAGDSCAELSSALAALQLVERDTRSSTIAAHIVEGRRAQQVYNCRGGVAT